MSDRKWTEDQQAVIKNRDNNLLVSAAAGSGKTAVLVERIIRRVTDPADPVDIDRLLVVTFTRAAAGEMKERIGAALQRELEEHPDNLHLQKQGVLLHHAQISTIHGFCTYVIQNYFSRIGIDPGYRIADEGELKLLRADVMEALLERKYEEQDPAFLAFMDSYAPGKKDSAIEEILLKLDQFASATPYPEEWLDSCMAVYQLQDVSELQASSWMQELITETRQRLDGIRVMFGELRDRAAGPDGLSAAVSILEADLEIVEGLCRLETFPELRENLRKPGFKTFRVKLQDGEREEVKKEIQDNRSKLRDWIKSIYNEYFYCEPEEILQELRQMAGPMQVLTDLEKSFIREFAQAKRTKNIADFSDLEHFALEILVEKDAEGRLFRTDAARELAHKFQEVMIDEYQDSNRLQECLIAAVSGNEEGIFNRFMVGDIKQSIYRFRMADPGIFREKYLEYPSEHCVRIDLNRNFRSRPEVLESINAVFSRIMIPSLGGIPYDDAAALKPGADYLPKAGAFRTELLLIDSKQLSEEAPAPEGTYSNLELEALAVANRIKDLKQEGSVQEYDAKGNSYLREVHYRDIVILLRSGSNAADTFARVLKEEGIPAYATSREGYFSAVEVTTVMNYLRILDNPLQDIPLTAILRSPIVGCTDADLAAIRIYSPKLSMQDAIEHYRNNHADALAQKLHAFLEQLEDFRSRVSYTAVHDLIRQILDETGYGIFAASMPAGQQREANLRMLIEKAVDYESTSYHGLFQFVRYIEKLEKYKVDDGEVSIYGESEDTVRIMTIHASKGLEFPIVFVSLLGKQMNQSDSRALFTLHAEMGIGAELVDLQYRTRKDTYYRTVIKKRIVRDSFGEEMRVLYVAMTRAREKLILTGCTSDSSAIGRAEALQGINDRRIQSGAERIHTPIAYEYLIHAKSYLDWILSAMPEEQVIQMRKVGGEDLTVSAVTEIGLLNQELARIRTRLAEAFEVQNSPQKTEHSSELVQLLNEMETYRYPYQTAAELPAKLTVSDIKKAAMEAMEEEKGLEPFRPSEPAAAMVPAFIRDTAQEGTQTGSLTGAARGTVYHHFLQCFDYGILDSDTDRVTDSAGMQKGHYLSAVESEIQRMKSCGLLSPADAAVLQTEDLCNFLQTALGNRMRNAFQNGSLRREQPFVLEVKAKDIDSSWPEDENILVQGTIDAYFAEDGQYILVDYKTDRVHTMDGSDLVEKYSRQLEYYAMALERITGIPVAEKWIYSVTLGCAICLH